MKPVICQGHQLNGSYKEWMTGLLDDWMVVGVIKKIQGIMIPLNTPYACSYLFQQ
jgi:hypothetical protein